MKGFASVCRKELYILFASPIFYAVAFIFLFISGYFFSSAIAYFNMLSFQASQNPYLAQQLNFTDMVMRPYLMDLSIVLILMAPLLTMRLFAEERKNGTLELLFTYPIADRTTVLAKYTAVVVAYAVILAGTLPGIIMALYFGNPSWEPIVSGYLGILLLGSGFIALGTFTSSVTENQIIAAVLAFGALLMFWVIGWAKSFVGEGAGAVIDYLSITGHFDNFTKGVIDSRDLLYYVVFMIFFLFLTLRQMESYRWRG